MVGAGAGTVGVVEVGAGRIVVVVVVVGIVVVEIVGVPVVVSVVGYLEISQNKSQLLLKSLMTYRSHQRNC